MGIVFIIGVVQAFFIEFLLLSKKKKNLSDKILAVWMFVTGLHLFLHYLHYIKFYNSYPDILGFEEPFPLLHGPLLLRYVQSLISGHQKFRKRDWIHLIPALGYFVCLLPDILFLTNTEKLTFVFEQIPVDPPLYIMFFGTLVDLSGVVYVTWSFIVLRRYQRTIKDNFSYTEKINLDWLKMLILGMSAIWLTVLITTICEIRILGDPRENSNYIFVVVTVYVFLIGFFGSRQGSIFTDNESDENSTATVGKYEKSSLSTEKSETYLRELKEFMSERKPHLQNKITLKNIADSLGIHQNHLSQVINEHLNQNFFDFINSYRVEEVKERIKQDGSKKLTILAHAYDSGFSSKSSFNEVFKKTTGMTPSQYQKQLTTK